MKITKKSLAAILAVLTIIFSICAVFTVNAATLKEGTYNKVTKQAYYKISVAEEGYITLTAKSAKSSSSSYSSASLECELLNSQKKSVTTYSSSSRAYSTTYDKSVVTKKIPVSKGTYYIYIDYIHSYEGGTNYIKYTFTSIKQPTNYCVAKATTLAASKKTTIYQTQAYSFDRWYKITLTKNQKVAISYTEDSFVSDIDLFDANGTEISLDYNNRTYTSKTKLAAGTYYICVDTYSSFSTSDYAIVMWK